MMALLFSLLTMAVFAAAPLRWESALEIVEKHDFYKNNEVLTKPRGSWEILFAFVYPDTKMNLHKDCLYYRIPGEESGVLKVKTTKKEIPCEKFRFSAGDQEWNDLKSLQYSITPENIFIHLTFTQYRAERWEIMLLNKFSAPEVKLSLSSADYLAPKLMVLAKVNEKLISSKFKDGICHDIAEDCTEKSPSSCHECEQGWYETPNGCSVAPKFCGNQTCGGKNQFACRRGFIYQRSQKKKYECRMDSSFAYCSKGLSVQCEGHLAYCR